MLDLPHRSEVLIVEVNTLVYDETGGKKGEGGHVVFPLLTLVDIIT